MKCNQSVKKSSQDIQFYKKNGPKFGQILKTLYEQIEDKTITNQSKIDKVFYDLCYKEFYPRYCISFPFVEVQNYLDKIFARYTCVSGDDCVAHGKSFSGSVLSVDCGITIKDRDTDRPLVFDAAFTVDLNKKKKPWILEPQKALVYMMQEFNSFKGPKDTYLISNLIHTHAKQNGLQVVVSMSGHGIGCTLHEHPYIYNAVPDKGVGEPLFDGLVLCIEPVFVLPKKNEESSIAKTYLDSDGWSIKTISGQPGSHFESMFLVEKGKLVDLVGITKWFC
jgi:methionyl aminopeptidase